MDEIAMGGSPHQLSADYITAYENLGLEEHDNAAAGQRPPPRVVSFLGSVLEKEITKNNKAAWKKNKDSNNNNLLAAVFHGSRAPSLTVHQYVDRIFRYSDCSPACFVVAYIYLDRFVARTGAVLTSLNVHRLLITSVMLAAKFLDDRCYNNGYYARVGGITNSELNKLELKLLTALRFQLHVTLPTFNAYCLHLIRPETQSPVNRRPPPVKLFGFRKYIGFVRNSSN